MHTVHHTFAFILKTAPAGEANERVWLFTREFGLVVAVVQGVRKAGAKLRMQLAEYSLVSADLVKGRDVWRLVSVSEIHNPFLPSTRASSVRGKRQNELGRVYVRTLSAVERFCHGEEANIPLFDHLVSCFETLTHRDLDVKSFDTLCLWKVMVHLGYCAVDEHDQKLFDEPLPQVSTFLDEQTVRRLVQTTNDIIQHTHL